MAEFDRQLAEVARDTGAALFSRRAAWHTGHTYGFSSAAIIPKFVLGRFEYWLSRKGWTGATKPYIRKDRSIVEQELNLARRRKKKTAGVLEF